MRRISIVLTVFAVVSMAAESRLSGQGSSSSASLTVNATVAKNCTISTTPVSFGQYDPVTANATSPLDGVGSVIVTCTKGAVAAVGLNVGGYPLGTGRRMFGGTDAFLGYELYSDVARAAIWGNESGTDLNIPAAPSRSPRTFTVYGRVPAAQDAAVGNYADTVVATVNF
jgi:spore coat protein U-like protein